MQVFRFVGRPSCKKTCICIIVLVLAFLVIGLVQVVQEILALRREAAYFEELDRIKQLDSTYRSLSKMGLSEIAEKPPPWNDRLQPLFPDVVQLRSWTLNQQLRLYPDGLAEYPMEHVWIYAAGNKTCPTSDGPAMCEDYINAFDRVAQYHHVKRPAAGAFLSFVDCDISPAICDGWHIDSNVLVNMQTMSPCTSHMPTEDDPEFRFICTTVFRFLTLPLSKMPTRSLRKFPGAYEQLLSLTTNDGFIDAIEPLDLEVTCSPFQDVILAS